jgi:hypothetical protein
MSRLALCAIAASALSIAAACQAVEVPGVYNNLIFSYYPPNGDPGADPNIGTAFDDWDNIPVAFSDIQDNFESVDIKTVKLANDENYLYVYVEYWGEPSLGTYLSLDTDNNLTTGYDIFGYGVVGAEASWQNDQGFSQRNGTWNEGVLYGGPFSNGGAPMYPFWNFEGAEREWMIPLNATHDAEGTIPVFTQDTISLLVWTQEGGRDLLDEDEFFASLTYTLATAPALAGDYNGDGFVNAADYTVWRDSQNATGPDLAADGNGDEIVNQADYDIWAGNYGAPGEPAAAGVPEPSAMVLAALGIGALTRRRVA